MSVKNGVKSGDSVRLSTHMTMYMYLTQYCKILVTQTRRGSLKFIQVMEIIVLSVQRITKVVQIHCSCSTDIHKYPREMVFCNHVVYMGLEKCLY